MNSKHFMDGSREQRCLAGHFSPRLKTDGGSRSPPRIEETWRVQTGDKVEDREIICVRYVRIKVPLLIVC